MTVVTAGLIITFFLLMIWAKLTNDKVDDLKFDSDENERRLNHQLKMLHDNKNRVYDLQQRLIKSEEKRKKMGDAFFHDLNILKERQENLVNLTLGLSKIDDLTEHSQDKAIESLEKSIETTDEMLLELATKVEYLENK